MLSGWQLRQPQRHKPSGWRRRKRMRSVLRLIHAPPARPSVVILEPLDRPKWAWPRQSVGIPTTCGAATLVPSPWQATRRYLTPHALLHLCAARCAPRFGLPRLGPPRPRRPPRREEPSSHALLVRRSKSMWRRRPCIYSSAMSGLSRSLQAPAAHRLIGCPCSQRRGLRGRNPRPSRPNQGPCPKLLNPPSPPALLPARARAPPPPPPDRQLARPRKRPRQRPRQRPASRHRRALDQPSHLRHARAPRRRLARWQRRTPRRFTARRFTAR